MSTGSASGRSADRLSVAAFVLSLCASFALLVLPMYTQRSESSVTDAAGRVTRTSEASKETLLHGAQFGALAILALPIVITGLAMLLKVNPRIRMVRTIVAAVLFLILPLGYFTIGGFYLPSAVAMLLAATRRDAPGDNLRLSTDRTGPPTTRTGGTSVG